MQTLKELYKVGPGPSSSHTLAPARACRLYLENYPETMTEAERMKAYKEGKEVDHIPFSLC